MCRLFDWIKKKKKEKKIVIIINIQFVFDGFVGDWR